MHWLTTKIVGRLARAFPGTRVLPRTEVTTAGLRPCVYCDEVCARVDGRGRPVHQRCANRAVGINDGV